MCRSCRRAIGTIPTIHGGPDHRLGRAGHPGPRHQVVQDDPLASYLDGEVCGREGGVEYVCETILRGRRGELVYDIDRQLVREIDTQFGRDVQLTLDVELQKTN